MAIKDWRKTQKERLETIIGWRESDYPYQLIEPRNHGIWQILIFIAWFTIFFPTRDTQYEPIVWMVSALGVARWYHIRVSHHRLLDRYDAVVSKLNELKKKQNSQLTPLA